MNNKNIAGWDKEYQKGHLGGDHTPDHALSTFHSQIPKGKVLDLGGGEGRNALFFARKGYDVQLIDCSETAVTHCMKRSKTDNISMDARVCRIQNFKIEPASYILIIASLVLQAFKKVESTRIISRLIKGLQPKGFLYVSVLSTDDSGYEKRKQSLEEVEKNTFYITDRDIYAHYFTKDEFLSLFSGWKLMYQSETRQLRTGTYRSEIPHQASLEFLGQKPD